MSRPEPDAGGLPLSDRVLLITVYYRINLTAVALLRNLAMAT